MRPTTPRSALSLAVVAALALSASATARDLGELDINVSQSSVSDRVAKQASLPSQMLKQSGDVLGRAAFTWVQRDLPAIAKSQVLNPEAAARAHLAALMGQEKAGNAGADRLPLVEVAEQSGSSQLLRFRSEIGGIEVFQEELALLLDGSQRLVAMRGPLPPEASSQQKRLPAFALNAQAAIGKALESYEFAPQSFAKYETVAAGGQFVSLASARGAKSASGALILGSPRAKQVYFRTHKGLLPAWYVETEVADSASSSADFYAFVISAVDGKTLFRHNQTAHLTPYTYRVFAEDGEVGQPLPSPEGRAAIPDPDGLPGHNQVLYVQPELRTRANSPFSKAATDAWLEPGAATPSGNNVTAYADIVEPDGFGAGDVQANASGATTFDYTYNPNIAADANVTQRMGAIVQSFYWVNWLHDWFYDSGFDEAAGNAQQDNYGRGGQGGDSIRAEAQDFAARNNANMSTPSDGRSPRMQLGVRTRATPSRDSSVDGSTIAHEWAHYLSNRLVGNSTGLITEHSGGMGEGWSDVVSLLARVKEEDSQRAGNDKFQGAYSHSGYSSADSYYGVRRYPYSTDMSKNPLTLKYISDNNFLPATPAPAFQISNSEVHNQGEVWAIAMWEGYVALLNDRNRLSFAEAQRRMKAYLVGGLKMTPIAPTMLEARDAFLATILASGEQADYDLFVAAFAKRGMGSGARIPDRYSDTMEEVIESFDIGGNLEVVDSELGVPSGCDADAALDAGETAMLTVTVRNVGFTHLSNARVVLTSPTPAISFPQGASATLGDLPLYATARIQVPVKLTQPIARASSITLSASAAADGVADSAALPFSISTYAHFDEQPRSSSVDEFEGIQSAWTNRLQSDEIGFASWTLKSEGNIRYAHGSDQNAYAVTWYESPRMSTGSGNLSVQVKHRYAFEIDNDENYDGGVIEVSTDDGATWTALDADIAGFAVKPLSDCCGNPLAGRRAFVGINPLYPVFEEQTFNLGTAFANQPNFRIRFGIATDANSNVAGWDIDKVTVSGLNDTPFSQVVEQSGTCSIADNKSMQGGLSGTYYDAQRSGEGVLLDFGKLGDTQILFFTWYTYENGQQRWLVGNTPFDPAEKSRAVELISTSGAEFGTAFSSQDVVSRPWGSVAVTFPGCDQMQLTYKKAGGESGTLTLDRGLQRLDVGQCGTLHGGMSGTYYSAERAGEGVLVDFGRIGDQPTEFFTWYTYEGGQQRWLVGSQTFTADQADVTVPLIQTQGAAFGSQFRAGDVQTQSWGNVQHRFIGCDTLEITYQRNDGQTATQQLTRGLERMEGGECR